MTEQYEAVPGLPALHTTPLHRIIIEGGNVTVECDDADERRVLLSFQTCQASRITTADCFEVPDSLRIVPGVVIEVHDSEWIKALKSSLSRVDETGTVLQKSRHFLVPLQDDFLEVVARGFHWKPIQKCDPG